MIDRIPIDPRICEGRTTIGGMGITVDFVLTPLGAMGFMHDQTIPSWKRRRLQYVS
jgi:uncharacterized protein (DUF433 family)